MERLRGRLVGLMSEELKEAQEKPPDLFASDHEAYAVLKEEIEEAKEEYDLIVKHLDYLWKSLRNEESVGNVYELIKNHALLMAGEAVQVAAMCEKRKRSAEEWNLES